MEITSSVSTVVNWIQEKGASSVRTVHPANAYGDGQTNDVMGFRKATLWERFKVHFWSAEKRSMHNAVVASYLSTLIERNGGHFTVANTYKKLSDLHIADVHLKNQVSNFGRFSGTSVPEGKTSSDALTTGWVAAPSPVYDKEVVYTEFIRTKTPTNAMFANEQPWDSDQVPDFFPKEVIFEREEEGGRTSQHHLTLVNQHPNNPNLAVYKYDSGEEINMSPFMIAQRPKNLEVLLEDGKRVHWTQIKPGETIAQVDGQPARVANHNQWAYRKEGSDNQAWQLDGSSPFKQYDYDPADDETSYRDAFQMQKARDVSRLQAIRARQITASPSYLELERERASLQILENTATTDMSEEEAQELASQIVIAKEKIKRAERKLNAQRTEALLLEKKVADKRHHSTEILQARRYTERMPTATANETEDTASVNSSDSDSEGSNINDLGEMPPAKEFVPKPVLRAHIKTYSAQDVARLMNNVVDMASVAPFSVARSAARVRFDTETDRTKLQFLRQDYDNLEAMVSMAEKVGVTEGDLEHYKDLHQNAIRRFDNISNLVALEVEANKFGSLKERIEGLKVETSAQVQFCSASLHYKTVANQFLNQAQTEYNDAYVFDGVQLAVDLDNVLKRPASKLPKNAELTEELQTMGRALHRSLYTAVEALKDSVVNDIKANDVSEELIARKIANYEEFLLRINTTNVVGLKGLFDGLSSEPLTEALRAKNS